MIVLILFVIIIGARDIERSLHNMEINTRTNVEMVKKKQNEIFVDVYEHFVIETDKSKSNEYLKYLGEKIM